MERATTTLNTYRDLRVYQNALDLCLKIFETTKRFPQDERAGLIEQARRSSRTVCAHLAGAWYRRRSPEAFVAKLGEAEVEAAEAQVWVDVARRCGYLAEKEAREYHEAYDRVLAQLAAMAKSPEKWAGREKTPPVAPTGARGAESR